MPAGDTTREHAFQQPCEFHVRDLGFLLSRSRQAGSVERQERTSEVVLGEGTQAYRRRCANDDPAYNAWRAEHRG